MKKSLLAVAVMSLFLAACGGEKAPAEASAPASTPVTASEASAPAVASEVQAAASEVKAAASEASAAQ